MLAGPDLKQLEAYAAKMEPEIKKNPAVVQKKWFLKKASLVNFKLPITVRLRTGDRPTHHPVAAAAGDADNTRSDNSRAIGRMATPRTASLSTSEPLNPS